MSNRFVLRNVRLSHPSLFNKTAFSKDDPKPKFEASFMIDKDTQPEIIELVESKIEEVLIKKFGTKDKIPNSLSVWALTDGDTKDAESGHGQMIFKGKSKSRPTTIKSDADNNKTPITEEDGILYAGCYVHASVSVYYMKHATGGHQLNGNVHGVMFYRDGESFGSGGGNVSGDFDDGSDDDF